MMSSFQRQALEQYLKLESNLADQIIQSFQQWQESTRRDYFSRLFTQKNSTLRKLVSPSARKFYCRLGSQNKASLEEIRSFCHSIERLPLRPSFVITVYGATKQAEVFARERNIMIFALNDLEILQLVDFNARPNAYYYINYH